MELTPKERSVVECLRRRRIATMKDVRDELGVSHMTVVRALKKHGYHTSVNQNGAFYVLREVPRFDADGLWHDRGVCFSEYGTLAKTLIALTESSPGGATIEELEERVHTKVGNVVSSLCREGRLARGSAGRRAVYFATDEATGNRQRRQREEEERRQPAAGSDAPSLPPRCDVVIVLEILIQIIKTPAVDAAELASALRDRGVKITAAQVQRVLDFYAIKKKRHHRRRRTRDPTDA